MFRASLRPSSGGQTALHCLWFSVLLKLLWCWRFGWQECTHSCHPTLQHHNNYNRTENHRQCKEVWPPDDGHKDARNMLRNTWLPINHYCCIYVYLLYLCFFVVNICVFVVLLCVFVVSCVYLLYFLCVFVEHYVYLLYLMCICCTMCILLFLL